MGYDFWYLIPILWSHFLFLIRFMTATKQWMCGRMKKKETFPQNKCGNKKNELCFKWLSIFIRLLTYLSNLIAVFGTCNKRNHPPAEQFVYERSFVTNL